MQRTIKFRGRSLDGVTWVYGDYHRNVTRDGTSHVITVFERDKYSKGYEVDPLTVGQFTGAVDDNGAEVYDGDLLKAVVGYTWDVFWSERHLMWRLGKGCVDSHRLVDIHNYGLYVIGNIHDNPSLLTNE